MSRETRLVVVLVAFGVFGAGSLACVADQYRKRLRTPQGRVVASKRVEDRSGLRPDVVEPKQAAASHQVEAFVSARIAGSDVCQRLGVRPEDRSWTDEVRAAYRVARLSACSTRGMSEEEYAAVRTAWRAWTRGEPVADPGLAQAFAAERTKLEDPALRRFEALDDAIR